MFGLTFEEKAGREGVEKSVAGRDKLDPDAVAGEVLFGVEVELNGEAPVGESFAYG